MLNVVSYYFSMRVAHYKARCRNTCRLVCQLFLFLTLKDVFFLLLSEIWTLHLSSSDNLCWSQCGGFQTKTFSAVSSVRRNHGQCVLRQNREPWAAFDQFCGTTSIIHYQLLWGSDKHSHCSIVRLQLFSNSKWLKVAKLNISVLLCWVCFIKLWRFFSFDSAPAKQFKLVGSRMRQANELVTEW